MNASWKAGNTFKLIENGEAFYPRIYAAIESAQKEVLIETFILKDDLVGQELREVMIAALKRGVQVEITVDGFGSASLNKEFITGITRVGGRFHIYGPSTSWLGLRLNFFRRMHRKLIVIDTERAFIGGINFGMEYSAKYGNHAKQDYAVEVTGPVVKDIHDFIHTTLMPNKPKRWWHRRKTWREILRHNTQNTSNGLAAFVIRDNGQHQAAIEQHYRIAFRSAQHELLVANAYFFPGYRFLRDLRRAARRGVRVRLILQGNPDILIAKLAANMLYDYLLSAGIQIYEYCERPFHGKVGIVDYQWATIGSSNLDPISLALNLEANLMIRDVDFSAELRASLENLMEHHCKGIKLPSSQRYKMLRAWLGVVIFHCLRRFPLWLSWIPFRKLILKSIISSKTPS